MNLGTFRPADAATPPSYGQPVYEQPAYGQPVRPARKPPRDQGNGWFRGWTRIALVAGAVLVCVIAVAAVAISAVLAPGQLVQDQIVARIKQHTGRDLTIAGGVSLRLFPSASLTLSRISLSPAPGMAGPPTVEAAKLRLDVALLPLLSRRIVVERIHLDQPVLDLRVDKAGRKSWDLASPYPTQRVRYAAIGAVGSGGGLDYLDTLELRSIGLAGGLIRYTDELTGRQEVATGVELALTGRRITDPMRADGALTWGGERVKVSATLETVRKLIGKETAKAQVELASAPLAGMFTGTLLLGDQFEAKGEANLRSPSAAALMRWLGTALPNGKPLGAAAIEGYLAVTGPLINLGGARLTLGHIRALGSLSVRGGGARPTVNANLKVSELDLDKLSSHLAGAHRVVKAAPAALRATRMPAAAAGSPRSIEDLIHREAPGTQGSVGRFSPQLAAPPSQPRTQVRGYLARAGWSTEPIVPAALLLVDGQARLSIEGLKVGGIAIGRSLVRIKLEGGAGRADIDDMVLYGGRGKGVVTANPHGEGIAIGLNIRADGVDTKSLFTDAADLGRFSGTGRLTAALAGQGATEQAIVSSLRGESRVVITNGAVAGWDVERMVQDVRKGQLPEIRELPSEKTHFSELSATFKISGGVAHNADLKLASPSVQLTGSGTIDLGGRQLNMLMRPVVVTGTAGAQRGRQRPAGIEVPVRVAGTWEKPQVTVLYDQVLDRNERLKETVRSVRETFKGKDTGEVVRDLLGNGPGAQSVKKAFKDLFR